MANDFIHIPGMMKIVHNKFENEFNKQIDEFELTTTQAEVLGYLFSAKKKNVIKRDLEKKFNLTHPTVIGIIKRLEAKGFIQCVPSELDKRQKIIALTDKSINLQKSMISKIEVMNEKLFKNISPDKINQFKLTLEKLLANICE